MSSHPGKVWTYEDYAALADDGRRYEVIDGELFEMASPNVRHQRIVFWLGGTFFVHISEFGGGQAFASPLDTVLSPKNVVQPDVLYLADADAARITEANLQGAPTLAVEVLSDARHDRVRKRRLYEQFGVREYWIVDPRAERVEVYRLAGDAYPEPGILRAGDTLSTDLIPGLVIDVAALLAAGR